MQSYMGILIKVEQFEDTAECQKLYSLHIALATYNVYHRRMRFTVYSEEGEMLSNSTAYRRVCVYISIYEDLFCKNMQMEQGRGNPEREMMEWKQKQKRAISKEKVSFGFSDDLSIGTLASRGEQSFPEEGEAHLLAWASTLSTVSLSGNGRDWIQLRAQKVFFSSQWLEKSTVCSSKKQSPVGPWEMWGFLGLEV